MNYKLHSLGIISILTTSIFDIISTTLCFEKYGTGNIIYEANLFMKPYIYDPFVHFGVKCVVLIPIILCAVYIEKLVIDIKNKHNTDTYVQAVPYLLISIFLIIAVINNFRLYFTNVGIHPAIAILLLAILAFVSLYMTLVHPLSNLGE